MKFKFETGEVIECSDVAIANLLRVDKRYKEVKEDAPKGKGKKADEVKEDAPKGKGKKADEVKEDAPKGDDLNAEVQE